MVEEMSIPYKIPGRVQTRAAATAPSAYAVFDCETTGTTPGLDEIVSLAVIRLDTDGLETGRLSHLVRPSRPIPSAATAVHGLSDKDVAAAPRFVEIAPELLELLAGAVFVAHNARFDLAMLQHAFARAGIDYRPVAVGCTLDAFRLLEPLAPDHRLESLCMRRGIDLSDTHDAPSDVSATAELLRLLLDEGIAPETIELDHEAFMRLRSRGETRPATAAQIRRVFALGYAAGLSRDGIREFVAGVARTADVDALNREQVQDVYDALEQPAGAPIGRAA
jgi:DNA polymerase III epsilon subunit family exonuclease